MASAYKEARDVQKIAAIAPAAAAGKLKLSKDLSFNHFRPSKISEPDFQ
jgi:hypothetical protein